MAAPAGQWGWKEDPALQTSFTSGPALNCQATGSTQSPAVQNN